MADLRFHNIVNGESVGAADGATYDLVNPATGEVYAAAAASGAEDVDRAMRAAEAAFETWGDTTPTERQRALLKIADALEARADEFVKWSRRTPASRCSSPPTRSCRPASTSCASSPARRGCWRAAPAAST